MLSYSSTASPSSRRVSDLQLQSIEPLFNSQNPCLDCSAYCCWRCPRVSHHSQLPAQKGRGPKDHVMYVMSHKYPGIVKQKVVYQITLHSPKGQEKSFTQMQACIRNTVTCQPGTGQCTSTVNLGKTGTHFFPKRPPVSDPNILYKDFSLCFSLITFNYRFRITLTCYFFMP